MALAVLRRHRDCSRRIVAGCFRFGFLIGQSNTESQNCRLWPAGLTFPSPARYSPRYGCSVKCILLVIIRRAPLARQPRGVEVNSFICLWQYSSARPLRRRETCMSTLQVSDIRVLQWTWLVVSSARAFRWATEKWHTSRRARTAVPSVLGLG